MVLVQGREAGAEPRAGRSPSMASTHPLRGVLACLRHQSSDCARWVWHECAFPLVSVSEPLAAPARRAQIAAEHPPHGGFQFFCRVAAFCRSVGVFSVRCSCPSTEHSDTDTELLMTTIGRAGDYVREGNNYIWEGTRLHLGGYSTTFGRACDYVREG